MAEAAFDQEAVDLAKKLHRNFLKFNQNAPSRGDWKQYYEQAARFLRKWNDAG